MTESSMFRTVTVKQMPIGAATGKRLGLQFCLMMLGAGLACASALGAAAPKAGPTEKTGTAQGKDAVQGNYVGGDVCATCHEEVSKKFAGNPHTKLVAQHGAAG